MQDVRWKVPGWKEGTGDEELWFKKKKKKKTTTTKKSTREALEHGAWVSREAWRGQRSGGGGGGSHRDTEDGGRKLHHPEQAPATTGLRGRP